MPPNRSHSKGSPIEGIHRMGMIASKVRADATAALGVEVRFHVLYLSKIDAVVANSMMIRFEHNDVSLKIHAPENQQGQP